MTTKWSLVIIHEGYTTTQKILERGFAFLEQTYKLSYRTVEFRPDTIFSIGDHEIPVLVRCASPWVANFTKKLVEAHKPYFYFIDDDFWSINLSSPLGQYYRSPLILESLKRIIKGASVVVTNTNMLANRVRRINANVRVIPAFVDFDLIDKKNAHASSASKSIDTLRIGFASNHSRLPDFLPIEETLLGILRDYPNCELDVIGFTPARLHGHPSVNVFSHLDSYEEYIEFQLGRAWDIGLAPLRPTKQNSSKTNNKYREYAAMSIAGIYADEAPYFEVADRVNGMKAGFKPAAWDTAIRTLLDDSKLRKSIVANGLAAVREIYGMDRIMHDWFTELEALSKIDSHTNVDWYRENQNVNYSRLQAIWHVYRVLGFRKWLVNYARRLRQLSRRILSRSAMSSRFKVHSAVLGSLWQPPRNRFSPIQPLISVVFTVEVHNSITALRSAISSVIEQVGSPFELILVVDTQQPELTQHIRHVAEVHDNVGVIFHQQVIGNSAISFAEGYLKTRGKYILPTSGEFVFSTSAFSALSEPLTSKAKLELMGVVALPTNLEAPKCFDISENGTQLFIWPAKDKEISVIALLDRQIFENVGLLDPHQVISGYSQYDLWHRILAEASVVSIDSKIGYWQEKITNGIIESRKDSTFGKALHWIGQNRNLELRPNAIMSYDLFNKSQSLIGNKIRNPRRTFRIAVVSIGITNEAELHFGYMPKNLRKHFDFVSFRSFQDFDSSIFDYFDAIVWTGRIAGFTSTMEHAYNRRIPQYLFASNESTFPPNILESGLLTAVLAPNAQIEERIRSLNNFVKVLQIPFWLSKSQNVLTSANRARDSKLLTVVLICEKRCNNRFRAEISPLLCRIAQELRVNLKLVVLSSTPKCELDSHQNAHFSVEQITLTQNRLRMLRQLNEKHPDFIIWVGNPASTLLTESGVSREAIAALLGCFSCREVNFEPGKHSVSQPITLKIDNSNEIVSLKELLTKLVREPELREKLSKDNRVRVWHSPQVAVAKRTLHEVLNSH